MARYADGVSATAVRVRLCIWCWRATEKCTFCSCSGWGDSSAGLFGQQLVLSGEGHIGHLDALLVLDQVEARGSVPVVPAPGSLSGGRRVSRTPLTSELYWFQTGSCGCVDERSFVTGASLNGSPLAHNHLQLVPCVDRVRPRKGNHASRVGSHGGDLRTVILYMAVSRDDEPTVPRDDWYPLRVLDGRRADRARRSGALSNLPTRVSWVGDIRSQGCECLRQPQNISVDVEANGGFSRHAARTDAS
ncbi:hypothetical protein EV193_105285 [Herbihabitans rhizosphaerae]|uniref:Uncharacterized protein n=1 Tax=Herbihabitans rhizosphaerae TaxID=1872711 RepID=A0A4Q7KN45_9PSEU|nr:hypothetical protein EV193_105285 [Herbihabitans rhizosphaerae]